MKKIVTSSASKRNTVRITTIILLISCFACTRDFMEPVNVTSNNEELPVLNSAVPDNIMILCKDQHEFVSKNIGSSLGSVIDRGGYEDWGILTRLQSGNRQFMFGHFDNDTERNKYFIMEIEGEGELGVRTDYGEWGNRYISLVGFHFGLRGFIFGQSNSAYGNNHYWFVQEVTDQGKLVAETDNGTWNNFYETAVPFYVNGKTYIFFQTKSNNNYWFIAYVTPDGLLYDLCDGHWGNFWDNVTSVEIQGKTYLVGHRNGSSGSGKEWFIQQINADGSMGPETDRGTWNNYYSKLIGYNNSGIAYIMGYNTDGFYFIQKVTADGKMGAETSNGYTETGVKFLIPYTKNNIQGDFRYIIGWDLSKSNGTPSRSWSPLYSEPWSGKTKFGGGAALADIDLDINKRYDAVLAGIQDQVGADRFYYKVAWNLDGTGKAASWSQAMYGPACGEVQAGGGADIGDIDGNGIPDLLLMSVDDPEGTNSFRYYIGWNMGKNGMAVSWSGMIQAPTLGHLNAGAGAALGDIDKNGRPELVLMGIDNPDQANTFWYTMGKNLDKTGNATSWLPIIKVPFTIGWSTAGGGAALADIDGNGKLDLVLTSIDNPKGDNEFWIYVGWDININGSVTGWSDYIGPKPGWITEGGGAAIADIDKNGILDLLLMAIDNPYGAD